MKPWQQLGEHQTPDGTRLTLMKHDRDLVILANGKMLMSSRMHGSEEELAALGCKHLANAEAPRVLVGGLGLGYTLRATLDLLPPSAEVIVAELVEGVVEWNRGPLGPLANHPLDDPRVIVALGDVGKAMRLDKTGFDAILLTVGRRQRAGLGTVRFEAGRELETADRHAGTRERDRYRIRVSWRITLGRRNR